MILNTAIESKESPQGQWDAAFNEHYLVPYGNTVMALEKDTEDRIQDVENVIQATQ